MIMAVMSAGPVASMAAGPATVRVKDIAFKPATTRITRGHRVTWRFLDGQYVPHNVRSVGAKRFKSSSDRTDGTYTVRFRKAGTYRYRCTLHAGMTGKIIVS